jgi:hypothetical protein
MTIALFVKRSKKTTLDEVFEEAISMEKDLFSLKGNLTEENKPTPPVRKPIPQPKVHSFSKKDDAFDMESLQRIINTLSDEIIDLKKSADILEVSSLLSPVGLQLLEGSSSTPLSSQRYNTRAKAKESVAQSGGGYSPP